MAIKKQSFLRAVAQMALVIGPAARHTLPQAQFFQQVLNLGGVIAGQGQVVRGQRAGHTFNQTAPAVAAGFIFKLQQDKIFPTLLPKGAGCGQSGHAATGNHHLGLVCHRWQWPAGVAAQTMASFMGHTREAALDVRCCILGLAACISQCGGTGGL